MDSKKENKEWQPHFIIACFLEDKNPKNAQHREP